MRARNLKPGFFANEQLAECCVAARLAFAGLSLMADREGRIEDRPKRIKGTLFPFDALDVEPLLRELCGKRLIVRYSVDGKPVIWIPTFLKHQKPHRLERPSDLPSPPENLAHWQSSGNAPNSAGAADFAGSGTPLPTEERSRTFPPLVWDEIAKSGTWQGGSICPESLNPESIESLNPESREKEPGGSSHSACSRMPPLALVGNSSRNPDDGGAKPSGEPVNASEESATHDGRTLTIDPTAPPSKRIPACPHLAVLALWAEVLPDMPQHLPGLWRGPRADHLRCRWREAAVDHGWTSEADGLTYFRRLFAYVRRSAFLTGKTGSRNTDRPPFVIELEWLVRPSNWAKVIEGKYHEEQAA